MSKINSIKFFMVKFHRLATVLLFAICFSSCVNTREATYFNDLGNEQFEEEYDNLEPVLRENDILSISVSSLNQEAAEIFNSANLTATQTSSSTGTTTQASGYLIDQDGNIRFPLLGTIKAAGKTKKELREEITGQLLDKKLLLGPIVDVRYLNYRVSVLGEVRNPSVLTIPNEKVTILEALGLAGDLTIYAKRDNVLLIRTEDGVKKTHRIDLTTDEIFTSPFYFLKSNDVVYVQPNKSKVATTNSAIQWLPVIMSATSLIIIAINTGK